MACPFTVIRTHSGNSGSAGTSSGVGSSLGADLNSLSAIASNNPSGNKSSLSISSNFSAC